MEHSENPDLEIERVLLSYEEPDEGLFADCDGFILTGGVDISPELYNGELNYPLMPQTFEQARDAFESTVYKYAKRHRKPILAICRGMQLVHVLEGGRLIQDLGHGNTTHKKDTDQDKQHSVQLQAGSWLHHWNGAEIGAVNSAHHQALDAATLSDSFSITATALDGTVEAIEWRSPVGKAFFIGVQWHPERMLNKEHNPLSQAIKTHFLTASSAAL